MCEVILRLAEKEKGWKPETRLKLKEFVACQTVANVELETPRCSLLLCTHNMFYKQQILK